MKATAGLLLLCALQISYGADHEGARSPLPSMFLGRRQGGFINHLHKNVKVDPAQLDSGISGSGMIEQKLDHFDSSNTKTWNQNYFFNNEYHRDGSNVNILYISGEQAASNGMISSGSSYSHYARILKATLYALEHRFYGDSHPTKDTSVDNLNKYLNSRQAVEDIAEFIRQKNAESGGEQKWILIGGSYAGALAAWTRLKHPELVAGSLASSGPVLAQMDFYGYLQTVDEVFEKQGGLCYDQISKGLEEARRLLMSSEGRKKLTDDFRIRPALDQYNPTDNDIDTFYLHLISEFKGAAQYGFPAVDTVCFWFTQNGDSYDPLLAFKTFVPTPLFINFTANVESLSRVAFHGDISERLWLYQTCAEFGYFQSTNRGTNVFATTQSSSTFIEYCYQLFGIDADQIQKNVDSVNEYYGGRDYYEGTNVVFTHGTQDPWSFLTKKDDSRHPSVVILEIEGGTHCADLGVSCSQYECTDNMKQVQQITLDNMQKWINPTEDVPDHIEIKNNVGKRPENVPIPGPILTSKPTPQVTRAERMAKSEKTPKKRVDFSKWNKFTGKGRRIEPPAQEVQFDSTTGTAYIDQTWDHFNTTETRTFKQKWHYNTKYGTKNGPNFLMIGGEVPQTSYWVSSPMAWTGYAHEVQANLFDLEHRYYGESKLGTNDLQYLTSAQMLYDVAAFIRTRQEVDGLTGPWITFGGSYAGALTAWSREWFPELIAGAVASSAPVLSKNDFYEYLEVVGDVVNRRSPKCYDRTKEAFEKLELLVRDPAGRKTISDKFKLRPAWKGAEDEVIEALDINEVFMGLYGVYQGTVQNAAADGSDVKTMCMPMINEANYPDPVDALRAIQEKAYGSKRVETMSSYDADMEALIEMKDYIDGKTGNTPYNDNDRAALLWTWQTCNEFGYFQSTDYGAGIFGTPVPLNFFIIMCERVFGVGMDHVEAGVANSLYQYGGKHKYDATNVVLVNGNADPYHALGITERLANLDSSVVPILIDGTSHCADMYGPSFTDPQSLTDARKTILENIKQWIYIPSSSPYCGCELIQSVHPLGWNANEIWLDVVVVLDTSEAMGADSLSAASSMVEAFVSDGALATDLSAQYSTRVGVISMANDAQVMYDMNLSKGKPVVGKVQVTKGLSEIDIMKAFNAASDMLARGLKNRPERSNYRQVIYYATNSAPKGDLSALNKFKSGGVIVINNFLKSGGSEIATLKTLASDGYFLKDARNNFMLSVQSFCKANCFCASDRQSYNGKFADAAVAAGGCYNPVATAASFSKAQDTCASNRGGIIAGVHDEEKGAFLDDLVLSAYKKKYFFWIGYSKNDAGNWVWEDKSSDSYTNWAAYEPSTASISKCANVDMDEDSLAWGAGNCNIAFPYVCEYAPCSAGNKNC